MTIILPHREFEVSYVEYSREQKLIYELLHLLCLWSIEGCFEDTLPKDALPERKRKEV